MATNSYPAVGDDGDLDDDQWIISQSVGDGIVEDYGTTTATQAFQMTLNNATNEATFAVGKVRVAGYIGDNESTTTLSVPAVGSTTTYFIHWQFDPALNVAEVGGERSALGPVRLVVSTGSMSTSGGKQNLCLYKITRAASQVLTAATIVEERYWAGPTISLPAWPAGSSNAPRLPRGTILFETAYLGSAGLSRLSVYTLNAAGNALTFQSLTNPPDVAFPFATGAVSVNAANPARMSRSDGDVMLRGTVKRSNGNPLGTGAVVLLGTLPVGWRPEQNYRGLVYAAGSPNNSCSVVVDPTSGQVLLQPDIGQSSVAYVHLDGITYRVGS